MAGWLLVSPLVFWVVVIFSDFLEIPSEKLGRRSLTVHPVQQLLCVLMPLVSMNQQSAKKQQKRKRAFSELDIVGKESVSAEWQREMKSCEHFVILV